MAMQEKSSKNFYPSIGESFKESETETQHYDVTTSSCSSGLDVHYSYKIVDGVTNPSEPTMFKFNPRMNSASVDAAHLEVKRDRRRTQSDFHPRSSGTQQEDCATRSRITNRCTTSTIRGVSRLVVVRDYMCKQQIDPSQLNNLAKAVLHSIPTSTSPTPTTLWMCCLENA